MFCLYFVKAEKVSFMGPIRSRPVFEAARKLCSDAYEAYRHGLKSDIAKPFTQFQVVEVPFAPLDAAAALYYYEGGKVVYRAGAL